jgi:hypothetical protein
MMPAPSVATSVTSASPIISAAAVDAVRDGSRRLFCPPIPAAGPSISTPGNSAGHSGCHEVTRRRSAINVTTTSSTGFSTAPSTNPPARFSPDPGPQ